MLLAAAILVLLTAALVWERHRLSRNRALIPLRIAVTGTRGKSTVTRMLAAVLRECGRRVLAKTTGSEPTLILPDGAVEVIRRRGAPSIIEQKRLMLRAASMGVDTVVVEVMSIHAENHFVECQQILDPHMVVVTNFRVDHTAAVGSTRDDVAAVIGLDVPKRARVLVPAGECPATFRKTVARQGATLIEVPMRGACHSSGTGFGSEPLADNVDLVRAAASALGIDDGEVDLGLTKAGGDLGSVAAWRYRSPDATNDCYVVNAFAANDPESTALICECAIARLSSTEAEIVGLMTLRSDRGDRSLQWAEFLGAGGMRRVSRLYLCGLHAHAMRRRLMRDGVEIPVEVVRVGTPDRATRHIAASLKGSGGIIFGFGNLKGLGEALVGHWREAGTPVAF